jgi:hypothetical protein
LLVELVELVSTAPATATTATTTTTTTTASGRPYWWIFPQPSPGEQIRSRSIKHSTGHDHDQGDNAGPPLLVELVSTTQAKAPATITTRAAAPARLRWWNW